MAISSPSGPSAILRDATSGCWLRFDQPLETYETADPTAVPSLLRTVEAAVASRGLYAVGWVAYEAAPAFDAALTVRPPADAFPLLWFTLFKPPRPVAVTASGTPAETEWRASVAPDAYRAAFDRIKQHIREGDAYQVDLTYRLHAAFHSDPLAAFSHLVAAQKAAYGAFLSTPQWTLCSASPELFFSLDGAHVASRPMKGTAPRGLTLEQDRANAATLQTSEKDRAENVMIVDMVRNDLGRIAVPGSVSVPRLFTVEKYPTVWQMTSTVQAETHASVAEIFAALFPAASITGAPKSSAMRIIAENESSARRVYTGAIGFIAPHRRAQFNVAIRTLLIDNEAQRAEYGTGGGIVWDSECDSEQRECRTKALILTASGEPFSLLETLLWTPEDGVFLLREHLARLAASAEYFDFAIDLASIRNRLERLADSLPPIPHRVRLLVACEGAVTCETAPFAKPACTAPLRVALASHPVDKNDPFLYHKTTRRRTYTEALASRPGFEDVILCNARGEVTESTRANVVVEIDGKRCTPPVRCGLLPGTLRQHLLDTHALIERVITLDELLHSPHVWLANSLRGLTPVIVEK